MTILEYLEQWCDEMSPREFYRCIFPEGELERKGEYVTGKYTGIAVRLDPVTGKFKRRCTVTDDLDVIDQLAECDDFCVMAPISYAGKKRTDNNARFLYAIAVDVDGIKTEQYRGQPIGMADMFYQFDGNGPSNYLPKPTMIVFSGTGLHLYYVFERPIALYPKTHRELATYRERLTWKLWTQGLTTRADDVEQEAVTQAMRMPGTITRDGRRARAFWVPGGEKVTMEYMNQFVGEDWQTSDFSYKSDLTLSETKEKYPEWYDKRIVHGQPRGTWVCKRDLYEWWKRKIYEGAAEGHRYWTIMALAAYAKKCDIDEDELIEDALGMIDFLDSLTTHEDNHFTEADVRAAVKAYDDNYITYPIHTISDRCDIPIERNKRNYRKQEMHLAIARSTRDIVHPNGSWREGNGRPTMEKVVLAWQMEHPGGTKAACNRDTGLDPKTIRKWWKSPEEVAEAEKDVPLSERTARRLGAYADALKKAAEKTEER